MPFGDVLIEVCQKHRQELVFRPPNPIPKFQQIDGVIRDREWDSARIDSDERHVPESGIGDGVGLSPREKMEIPGDGKPEEVVRRAAYVARNAGSGRSG